MRKYKYFSLFGWTIPLTEFTYSASLYVYEGNKNNVF